MRMAGVTLAGCGSHGDGQRGEGRCGPGREKGIAVGDRADVVQFVWDGRRIDVRGVWVGGQSVV